VLKYLALTYCCFDRRVSVSVYMFIHLVPHVTLDMSITVYNLYITEHNLQYTDIHPI